MPEIDLKAVLSDPKRRKFLLIAGGLGIGAGAFVLWQKSRSGGFSGFNVTPGGLMEERDEPTASPYEEAAPVADGGGGEVSADQSLIDQLLGLFGAQQEQLSTDLAAGLEGLYANQQVLADQIASVSALPAAYGGGEVYYAPADSGYIPGAAAAFQPQAGDLGMAVYDPGVGFSAPGDVGPAASGLADSLFNTVAFQGTTPAKGGVARTIAESVSSFAGLVNQPVKVIQPASKGPTASAPLTGYTSSGVLGSKASAVASQQPKPVMVLQNTKVSAPAPNYIRRVQNVVRSINTATAAPKADAAPKKTIVNAAKTPVVTAPSARVRKV